MTHVLGLAGMLAAFWLLLSGHYTPLFLAFGLGSVALVTWLAHRTEIADHEGRPLGLTLRAPGLWLWLGGQILLSALDVARRIWSRRVGIAPTLATLDTSGMSDVAQVTYANSITLTPGTLSLMVGDHGIEVHALDPALVEDLRRGEMARRVRRMVRH